jgi:Leucine-rich repeat (LRR) protein
VKIDVEDNRRPELLKDIAHITFTNLTSLQLSENNIESVEELAFLFMPKIRWLYLGNPSLIQSEIVSARLNPPERLHGRS